MQVRALFAHAVIWLWTCSLAQAQDRGLRDQMPQDLSHPVHNSQIFTPPGVIPDLADILKNIHGSYAVSIKGPRFDGPSNETYNVYLPDVAPLQFFHMVKLGYQVSPDLQIGINDSVEQNLSDGVRGLSGQIYNRSFNFYDPNIYFDFPHLIKVPGWYVFTSASFSLPFTQTSQDQKKITEFIIQQSWSANTFPSKWTYGFHLYFNPQFYNDPAPDGYPSRQTLSFSFGHNFGYRVSPLFYIDTSTVFFTEHRTPDPKGFVHLGEGLPDYFQISANLTPNFYPLFASIGGFFQCLVFAPSFSTAIIGGNFKIGF